MTFFHRCGVSEKVALLTFTVATALPICAQVQSAAEPRAVSDPHNQAKDVAAKLSFDAASVRQSAQGSDLKGVDFLNPASDAAPPPGGLLSWNVQLPWLINFAYDLRSSQMRRTAREALPKWAQDDLFTIEARVEGSPSREDVRQMARSLLKERFQFSAHIGKRERQVYALVVSRPGFGLKPHPEGAPCTLPSSQEDEKKYPHLSPSYEAVPAHCGIFGRELSQSGEHRLEMLNVTMQQIAEALGLGLPLLVVDKTGLAGRYDAVLDFGPQGAPADGDSSDEIGLPPATIAVEKQLGLKLVKQSAQVDTLLIDHIEKLSEN
jgi:uncharacterized protein (TIGR03435 family)